MTLRPLIARLLALVMGATAAACAGPTTRTTGADGWVTFERRVETEIRHAGLPGATLAVLRGERVVYRRGFGLADLASGAPLAAEARLRIASVSKPVTALTMLRLAETGRLDLDAPVIERLAPRLGPDFTPHPGFVTLTARQLLGHCGGFDRERGFDPMLQARSMATLLGRDEPPAAVEIVAWALARPPDFAPGSRCVYSNLGYAVLGRLIEAVTGLAYGEAVRETVLVPAGVTGMRLAATRPQERQPDEPRYHDERTATSVFDPSSRVPLPDGALHLEAMDAHGGWLATSAELVRLVAALEGRGGAAPLISGQTRAAMLSAAWPPDRRGASYGLGWDLDLGGRRYWHSGDLPGSFALLVREANGTVWALLGNGSIDDPRAQDRLRRRIGAALRGVGE